MREIMPGVFVGDDNKWDIQLDVSKARVERLARILATRQFIKIEVKSETWLWQRTGNICIEFRQRGRPSGIAVTEADYWVHELYAEDGETVLLRLFFPIEQLREMARNAFRQNQVRYNVGDRGEYDVVLIKLKDILR